MDPKIDQKKERLTVTKDLKEIQIGPQNFQTTKLGASLTKAGEEKLIFLLKRNIDLFYWAPSNIPGIDARVVCHCIR